MGDSARNRTFPHEEGGAPPSPPARVFYEGCPGCAMDRKKENNTGIPYKESIFIAITTIASSLPISSLFPFLYFMIEDLRVAKREQDIGLYAGLLDASYMIGRCFASLFWGVVADRIGRKPIIAFSIFSVVIFNTLFGLSVKYWMAIASRFLLGALNGMLAPIKAYSVEVCRPEHHALGLSIVSTAWGIGLVVGPAIGGYFAQPAKQYPNLFLDKSVFGRFPYFLPCLSISLIALAVLISCIWLPTSICSPTLGPLEHLTLKFAIAILTLFCVVISITPYYQDLSKYQTKLYDYSEGYMALINWTDTKLDRGLSLELRTKKRTSPNKYGLETLHMHKNLEREVETVDDSRARHTEDSPPEKSLYKNWPLMSSIIAYCVFTLHDTAYSEIFSLWTVSDKKYGGLNFQSKEVGQVLAVSGAGLLVYQLFIYRSVHRFLGSVNSSRIASALSIPILAAYPFMAHLSGVKLGLALYTATVLKGALSITIITGTSILQNNAVSQRQRGAANGISTTAMSLFKAIAPAGAGVLFSWSQKRQNAAFFPGDQMIFLILILVELLGLALTFKPFLALP